MDLSKGATPFTKELNKRFSEGLDFNDQQDFEDSQRGFIARIDEDGVYSEGGQLIWALDKYDFEEGDCPDTVNPSLWRQSQLNHIHGLFKIADRIYQVRGMDMSNLTIIESDTGIILIDPLCCGETAAVALDLYYRKCGKKEIRGVLITHSHVDHYGGIEGVISKEDVTSGRVPVIVPEGFVFEVMSENAFVGTAMTRRSFYQYGTFLPKGIHGQVDVGLGKASVSGGSVTLLKPSLEIKEKRETHRIDGVDIEFMLTPGAEAPVEFVMYFPQLKMLQTAEEVTHTLHNILTLRGAQVRDSRLWWKIIEDILTAWGDGTDVICASHHWPTFGNERCKDILRVQRDMYKYMHDQCVRMINEGLNMVEIGEVFEYPPAYRKYWHMRGYYGSTNHNCKAVYQRYLGWYDGNPSNLHPYPPEDGAPRYVEMMGGREKMLERLHAYFDKGDYRWVAEVGKHLVFEDPTNGEATNLLADAYEQLAYQSENATWRNAYLSGALELRLSLLNKGMKAEDVKGGTVSLSTIRVMEDEVFYDFISCRLNGPKAWNEDLTLNIRHKESDSEVGVHLQHGVLLFDRKQLQEDPDVSLELDRELLAQLIMGDVLLDDVEKAIDIEGDKEIFRKFLSLFDHPTYAFNIVLP